MLELISSGIISLFYFLIMLSNKIYLLIERPYLVTDLIDRASL